MPRVSKSEQEQNLLNEVKQNFADCEVSDGEADNRQQMKNDLEFCYVPGSQWDPMTLAKRAGRPNYTYNRTVQAVNQVVGDQRQSRYSGKVRAVNKDASREVATIYGGCIRNIEACSSANNTYDDAFKFAVAGAYGAWRIQPYYVADDSFEQDLRILPIPNPFTVYWDPVSTDPCKGDANWCVVAERMNRDVFEAQYPNAELSSIDVPRDNRGWIDSKTVRVAEYFKRTAKDREIALLSDGRVVEYGKDLKSIEETIEELSAGGIAIPTITKRRKLKAWFVKWWKVNGVEILEGGEDDLIAGAEYRWKRIPVVRVPGRHINIEGRQYLQSLIRHAKDAQRTYNFNRSTMVEAVALTPKAPYVVTGKMIKGYEEQWGKANATNVPYLQYDVDPAAPNARPTREPPPDVPAALIALAAQDAEDIKQTTGYVNPAMPADQMGDAESGVALGRRLMAGGSGAYEFTDNHRRAIQLTHEMLIDMIPTVFDTERLVRVIGEDEVEDFVEVNKTGPEGIINDLKKGAYDVTVTMGPAYATARQEAVSTMMDAVSAMPIIGEECADLIVANLDVEKGDEITKRIRARMIREGRIQPEAQDEKNLPPPPPPDPVQTAMVERLQAQTAKDAAQAQEIMAKLPATIEQIVAEIVNKRLESLQLAAELSMTGADVSRERVAAADGNPVT